MDIDAPADHRLLHDTTRTCRTLLVAAWIVAASPLTAHAGLLDQAYPANIPAYQEWLSSSAPTALDPSYEASGIRAGSFIVRPQVSESFGYDSNISGSAVGRTSPERQDSGNIQINSDWSRNSISSAASVDNVRYLDVPSRSYTAWSAALGGVVEVGATEIRLGYLHVDNVSLPTDVGTFGLAQPIVNHIDDLRVSDTLGRGSLSLVPAVVGQIYRFAPLTGRDIGEVGLFDRDAVTASLTAGYTFAGEHHLLLVLSDSHVIYQASRQAQRPADFDDVSALAGVEYKATGLLAYRALIGYEQRLQSGGGTAGSRVAGPQAELAVIWTPTQLTTVTAQLSQGIVDQPTAPAQGLAQTSVQLIVAEQIRRNAAIQLSAGYDRAAFPDTPRVQSSIRAAAQVVWYVNRHLSFLLSYAFAKDEDSVETNLRFDRNVVQLQAKFGL